MEVRASDAEREAVVGKLNTAVGEGRLTLDEFSSRLGNAYEATTRGELEPLTADLPEAVSSTPAGGEGMARHAAGRHAPHAAPGASPRRTIAVTLIGGADLDLRAAQLDAPVVTLTKVSLIGGTRITVPPGVRVEVSGFSLIGGKRVDRRACAAGCADGCGSEASR